MDLGSRAWCIVKSAKVRELPDRGSNLVAVLPFMHVVHLTGTPAVNGFVNVLFYGHHNRMKSGWIPKRALTMTMVQDMSGLYFRNLTGRTLPARIRFYGENDSEIAPWETVAVYALCGERCLTNRGWTLYKWLTKDREIYNQAGIDRLYYGVLAWAAKDYRSIITRIKQHRFRSQIEFYDLMFELSKIMEWFLGDEYMIMFDNVSGEERLDGMNRDLGIDRAWLKERFRIYDTITERRRKKNKNYKKK